MEAHMTAHDDFRCVVLVEFHWVIPTHVIKVKKLKIFYLAKDITGRNPKHHSLHLRVVSHPSLDVSVNPQSSLTDINIHNI